jgi:beta-galactosidase
MYDLSARAFQNYPVFSPEVYTAWFSPWGGPLAKKSIEDQLTWTNWLLDRNYSFCFYMFHGGTNWGFSNGSNGWRAVQTSYDYDAPVDEAGRATPKYHALRELFTKRFNLKLPAVPADPNVIEIPTIKFDRKCPLIEAIPEAKIESAEPVSMEDLDQGYGLILYRHRFENGIKGTLELRRVLDYAVVMVNGKTVGKSFVGYGPDSRNVVLDEPGPATLDILVYNLGRVSSPFNQTSARKGMIESAYLDGVKITGWEIRSLPFEKIDHFNPSNAEHTGPTFYRGTFTLDQIGETFLDMRNWSFGAVWVNGHNLGRHWDRGGLRSLYLPSIFQKQGENEIIVLELHDAPKKAEVTGVKNIIEEPSVAFDVRR